MGWTVDGLDYTYRKKITIDNTNVDGDLTNFPLLVKISSDTDIGGDTNADGFDVRFTSSDGSTLLKFQRIHHTVTVDSLDAIYWVKVPTVNAATTTDIYIYFRSDDTADGADPDNTWSSTHFHGVWHLNETDLDGDAGDIKDSYSAGNDGKVVGSVASITGKIYKAIQGSDNTEYIEIAGGNAELHDSDGKYSCSVWFKAASSGSTLRIFTYWDGSSSGGDGWFLQSIADKLQVYIGELGSANYVYDLSDAAVGDITAWNHLAWSYNAGDANEIIIYLNGTPVAATQTGSTNAGGYSNEPIYLGRLYWSNSYYGNAGSYEEARYYKGEVAPEWFKFEFNNVNEADNELGFGDLEEFSEGGIIPLIMHLRKMQGVS